MRASAPHTPRVAVPPGTNGGGVGGGRGRPMANVTNTLSKEATDILLKQRDNLRGRDKDQGEAKRSSSDCNAAGTARFFPQLASLHLDLSCEEVFLRLLLICSRYRS